MALTFLRDFFVFHGREIHAVQLEESDIFYWDDIVCFRPVIQVVMQFCSVSLFSCAFCYVVCICRPMRGVRPRVQLLHLNCIMIIVTFLWKKITMTGAFPFPMHFCYFPPAQYHFPNKTCPFLSINYYVKHCSYIPEDPCTNDNNIQNISHSYIVKWLRSMHVRIGQSVSIQLFAYRRLLNKPHVINDTSYLIKGNLRRIWFFSVKDLQKIQFL